MISYVIRKAIPASWGHRISSMRGSDNLELIERLQESPKSAKWAYSKLIDQLGKNLDEKYHTKWEAEVANGRRFKWPKIYATLHFAVEDINLRWLNYRCIKRILPTNRLFFLYKIKRDRCMSKLSPYRNDRTYAMALSTSEGILGKYCVFIRGKKYFIQSRPNWFPAQEYCGLQAHKHDSFVRKTIHLV